MKIFNVINWKEIIRLFFFSWVYFHLRRVACQRLRYILNKKLMKFDRNLSTLNSVVQSLMFSCLRKSFQLIKSISLSHSWEAKSLRFIKGYRHISWQIMTNILHKPGKVIRNSREKKILTNYFFGKF